jgi:Flp pilus assembly protein TadB
VDPAILAAAAAGLAVLSWWPPVAARVPLREPLGRKDAEASGQRRRRLVASAATGLAVAFAASSFGWWLVPCGVGATVGSYLLLGQLRSGPAARRQARLTADLPQACDLLVVCLEAGLPLRVGAEAVSQALSGPMADGLGEVAAKVRLGIDEPRAWVEFATDAAVAKLGRELSRGVSSGASLVSRLRALGLDSRRAAEAAAETRAKKVGVRSVLPLMVCFLPAFVLVGVVPIVGGMVLKLFG